MFNLVSSFLFWLLHCWWWWWWWSLLFLKSIKSGNFFFFFFFYSTLDLSGLTYFNFIFVYWFVITYKIKISLCHLMSDNIEIEASRMWHIWRKLERIPPPAVQPKCISQNKNEDASFPNNKLNWVFSRMFTLQCNFFFLCYFNWYYTYARRPEFQKLLSAQINNRFSLGCLW